MADINWNPPATLYIYNGDLYCQPCGCRCDDCRDDTEPRCDVCNQLINTKRQCEDAPSHYQITDWEVRERLIEPSPQVSQRREIQGLG